MAQAVRLSPAEIKAGSFLDEGPIRLTPAQIKAGQFLDDPVLEQQQQRSKPEVGKIAALIRAGAQGATAGFADEITGFVESLTSDKTYKQARDESRAAYKAAEDAHPTLTTIGKIGGGIASALVPIGGAARATGFAAHALRGAGFGALSGAGESEGENVLDVAKDAAKGAAVGAAVGGTVGTIAEKVVRGAGGRADRRLLSEIGDRATPTARKKIADNAEPVKAVAREFGLDKVAKDPAKLADAAGQVKKHLGERIGAVYEEADQLVAGVPLTKVMRALHEAEQVYRKNPSQAMQAAADKVAKQIETLRARWGTYPAVKQVPQIPAAEVNAFKTSLQDGAFAGADLAPKIAKRAERDAAGAVKKVLEQHVDEVLGPEAADALTRLNMQYGAAKDIARAAAERGRLAPFSETGLRNIAGGALDTGSLIASIATGNPLPYVATKVGIPAARAGFSAADVALAKLYSAAQAGNATAEMVQRALEAGVPRALVERVAGPSVNE